MDLIFLFYYKEPLSLDKRATSSVCVKHELKSLNTWKRVCDLRQHITTIQEL